MEAIRECIKIINGKKMSSLEFEKLMAHRFLAIIDEMKSARALVAFWVDEKDCSNILFDPASENDKIMLASFIARSFTLHNYMLEILGLAKVIHHHNTEI